jgi:hypothetical protein
VALPCAGSGANPRIADCRNRLDAVVSAAAPPVAGKGRSSEAAPSAPAAPAFLTERASRHGARRTCVARKQGATRALRPSASARVSVGRAPDPDDTRASGPAPARRLFATTSRRVGRAFSSSTVSGRRACRSSRGPCGDAGNNPCRRQEDVVVGGPRGREPCRGGSRLMRRPDPTARARVASRVREN